VDKRFPDIIYVPEDARFDLHKQRVSWPGGATERCIKLLPGKTYVRPSGYKIRMLEPAENPFLAPGRDGCRGHSVSQAVHSVRWW